ncbi:hypothetical protein AV274_3449 [Blastocystis sp. ATCC 50177/Nand II]|uniref:Uncharacterized protein n=1 Tax=Blastocystis sp. subtype 1 (strain ATCC 50177 / NandII) TaxID=478820 RepID=A0A196SEK3_BLAHN|nr:hypothetical protein AV274_3449 [Blastocystis sp. ATCC 50177/Nand II]
MGNPLVASFSAARKRTAPGVHTVNKESAPNHGTSGSASAASMKGTKQTVADILKDIDMTSSELSTTEAKKLQELDKILSESPDLKNLSMDEIIGMLNISEEDKKQLASQVNDILKSGDLDMKDAELRKKFPAMDPTIENIMNDLEKEFANAPGVREEFQNWIASTQQKLGMNLEKMENMTTEEIDSLALPPPRVKEILDRIIPDTDKFNSLNLDEGMNLNMDFGGKGEEKKEEEEDGDEPIEVEEIKIR